jgi:hypothetical protein
MSKNRRQTATQAHSAPDTERRGGKASPRGPRRGLGRRLAYLAPTILFSFSISENAVAANSKCPPVTGLPPCGPRP